MTNSDLNLDDFSNQPGSGTVTQAPSELESEIRILLQQTLSARVGSNDTDLIQAGVFDSIGLVTFVLALEGRFGVKLPIELIETDSLRTISAIAELVRSSREP